MKKYAVWFIVIGLIIGFYGGMFYPSNLFFTIPSILFFVYGMILLSSKIPPKNSDNSEDEND